MELEATPVDGLIDERTYVRLREAPPGSLVEITATMQDGVGNTWSSRAVVQVREDGTASVGDGPPVSGSFSDADPTGLIWSASSADKTASVFSSGVGQGMTVAFTALTEVADPDETPDIAQAVVTRRYMTPNIEIKEVRQEGLVGVIFESGDERGAGVIMIPGALPADLNALPVAALLASRGMTVLVVEYQGADGLPEGFSQIPLETFVRAAEYLYRHPKVDRRLVAGYGFDRGAEALLATISYTPIDLRCAVAVSPSCVAWQASAKGKGSNASAWTFKGQQVPFMKLKSGGVVGQKLWKSVKRGPSALKLLSAYTESLKDPESFARACFPVERFAGPILMLAGDDDQVWPSGEMAELLFGRRRARSANLEDQRMRFEGAGHLLRFPYLPSTLSSYIDPDGGGLELGGQVPASVHGDMEAWDKTLDFLEIHLGSLRYRPGSV